MPSYELELYGELISHKNEKMAVMRKRKRATPKGAAGTFYAGIATKPHARASMDSAALQIPGELRNLKLRHPEMEISSYVGREDVDRDNILSTVLDLLVEYGVITDDNVRHFNGRLIVHPAIVGDEWKTLIKLRVPEPTWPGHLSATGQSLAVNRS